MKTKLRTTYLVTVLFFLFVTVGSMILLYNMFSEEFIIANNKKIMNSVFEDAQGMDLSSLTKSDRKRLKEFSDKESSMKKYMNIHIHLRQMCQRAEKRLDLRAK